MPMAAQLRYSVELAVELEDVLALGDILAHHILQHDGMMVFRTDSYLSMCNASML